MVMGLPMALSAGPITADFSTLSPSHHVTDLGTGVVTIGPVSAQAFTLDERPLGSRDAHRKKRDGR